jgi:hypothetical protein
MKEMKKMSMDLFTSVEEAKTWVKTNSKTGCICPCCNRLVKIYKRKLNSGMAQELIDLYSLSFNDLETKFYHHTQFAKVSGGELSKLTHWGLVCEKQNTIDDKRTSGFWGITEKGILFVENKISVEKYIYLLDAELISYSKETTNIIESLGSKFNYPELMNSYAK